MENREMLLEELKRIEKWEHDQKDLWFWEKLGRIPFALLDRITPKIVHERLGKLLDELGSYIQTGGQYLINEQEVTFRLAKLAQLRSDFLSLDKVADLPIQAMDHVATDLKESRKQFATMQGATTGFGGIFTLAIDIPALLGLSLKVLQEMALSYGFNPKDKQERVFIVKCLQFASSDYVGKQAIIKELTTVNATHEASESISKLEGWREVILTYGENYGWKKLFQLVPVVGIVFGAYINRSTIDEVAEAGQMLYRKRRILEKLARLENDDGLIKYNF
ncbi:EcsC family protein [Laceyella putida]|uniref:EcsC family protein n=1 Tax=Laceyella putida TaxID=110101 RepID=A0ABW2RJ25_9BACL